MDSVYKREADQFLSKRGNRELLSRLAAALKQSFPPMAISSADCETNDNSRYIRDLEAVRASRTSMAKVPRGVQAEMLSPTMRLYRPRGAENLPLLIYLHGGGWAIGGIASCSEFCGALAAKGVAVLALDYPLAPESPFPCAVGAVRAAFHLALNHPERFGCDRARISIGGDSSGGNLALATAQVLQSERLCPRSLVLYYPVVEARPDGLPSWHEYGQGYGMDAALMEAFIGAYLQGHPYSDPFVSPVFAGEDRLRKLPPIHILAAERDILRDQGIKFARRLNAYGCPIRYELLRGAAHLFVTVPGQPSAFRRAVDFAAEALLS